MKTQQEQSEAQKHGRKGPKRKEAHGEGEGATQKKMKAHRTRIAHVKMEKKANEVESSK